TELHGGTMRIRSQLGRGTIVLLRLPVDGGPSKGGVESAGGARLLSRANLRPNSAQGLNVFPTRGLRAVG
ncbi:MAG TPA: hypothetical protein VG291_11260, partial [Xanthobacteraceae bacterium]|nr:hypothetical protein [Xanthobacteraceae bacterium]